MKRVYRRRGGLTMAFPLGEGAVRCTCEEHWNHIRRRAVDRSCAVNEQPGAASLARIATAWVNLCPVCTTPNIAATLSSAHPSVLVGKHEARVRPDLVPVVYPRH